MKRNNTGFPHFIKISITVISILIICAFVFLGTSIQKMSKGTIDDIGAIYMAGLNEQVALHFETIIDLRLAMMDAIADVAADKRGSGYGSKEDIEYNTRARGFISLFLYSADGEIETIYGEPVEINNPELFLNSLKKGERKITSSADNFGNGVVLFGVPCVYPMSDGRQSIAIVAGLSSEYMSNVLFLDTVTPLIQSYVIRKDGSYVIRDQGGENETYFNELYHIFDGQNLDVEQYINELTSAMDANEDYSVILEYGKERRHLYCASLPDCEWYLVTVLPFDSLDHAISDLSSRWLVMVYIVCFAVIAMLVFTFIQYLNIFRKQMTELKRLNMEMTMARKAAEKAQKEAESANAAKREFLSNMSHDIRTPMNAIIGMTTIAMANPHNQERVQECLRKIALSGKHLLGLINDVLDMSKIESGKMTLSIAQVSLREVMDSIVNIIQPQIKAKKQQFNISIHDIIIEEVCCDNVRLNQILINLLGNAIKFTPDNGSIQVSLYQEVLPDNNSLIRTHFIVKDTGIGMSKEYQKKIFDSFSREDNTRVHNTEGSGLGMAITKYIVDAMGGTISVRSELGAGSEFHVILDFPKAEVKEMDMMLPNWNMLVVDDDEDSCISTANSLKSIGINPEWCLSAERAIEMVTERRQRNDDYQVILLDWKLPGMNGIEAAREIRSKYKKEIPILLITAYDWSEIEEEARQAGISGFIPKPLFKSTLFYGLKAFTDTPDKQAAEADVNSDIDLKGKRILLAEDNELNWEVAKELLSALEIELEWAENGKICVEKFEKAPVGYYDAVLMDIRMPVTDGYDAAMTIRSMEREDADIPIIAMTADAFAEDVQRCLDCGMNDHLAKPIDIQEVCFKLKKYLK